MTRDEYNTMVLESVKSRAESWGETISYEGDIAGVKGFTIRDYYMTSIGFATDIADLAQMYNVKYNYEDNENDEQYNP